MFQRPRSLTSSANHINMPSSSSYASYASTSASSASSAHIGELHLMDQSGDNILASRQVYLGHDLTIGRDRDKCQWVFDDPKLSAKHLRIYSIVYNDEDSGVNEKLIYAEDLSRHGTYWNESLIGKGNGGVLLSNEDKLRLSTKISFRFTARDTKLTSDNFDLEQETEMTEFQNQYVLTDRLLGAGAFGRVFMAIKQDTRTQVACKIIDLRKFSHTSSRHFPKLKTPVRASELNQAIETQRIQRWAEQQRKGSQLEERLRTYYREIDILSQLKHPNIIGFHKAYVTDNSIYMFQELVTAGDLFSYLESKNGRLLEVEAAVIVRQILVALKHLHDQNIVHRDLKPENILMTSTSIGCRVVLTDFGAARRTDPVQRMSSIIGSEQYAAPEMKKQYNLHLAGYSGYTKAVDMWSVGAITVVLLTGGSPFLDPSTGAYSPLLARTCNLDALRTSKEWSRIGPRPQDFIANLLVLNVQDRMTAQKALRHAWFSNKVHKTDFEELYKRTVKHWRPRTVQNPTVEFIDSTFVRFLEPSQAIPSSRKRSHPGKKPVEPPYKPFPRNMHAAIWPKRNPSPQVMSAEVKTANDRVWSLPTRRASHTGGPSTSTAPEKCLTPKIPDSKSLEKSTTSVTEATMPSNIHSAALAIRPMPPPSFVSRKEFRGSTSTSNNNFVFRPSRGQNPQIDTANKSPEIMNVIPQHSIFEQTSHALPLRQRRRLKGSSKSRGSRPRSTKRGRDSLFNVDDRDGDTESSDSSCGDMSVPSAKRRKLSGSESINGLKEVEPTVGAHFAGVSLDNDLLEYE